MKKEKTAQHRRYVVCRNPAQSCKDAVEEIIANFQENLKTLWCQKPCLQRRLQTLPEDPELGGPSMATSTRYEKRKVRRQAVW